MTDTLISEATVVEQKMRDFAAGNLGIFCDECDSELTADPHDTKDVAEGADMIRRLREALAEARRHV